MRNSTEFLIQSKQDYIYLFEIGFNTRYLLDVLNVMKSDEILMEFKSPMSPSVIRDPNNDIFLSVLMPLRTEW